MSDLVKSLPRISRKIETECPILKLPSFLVSGMWIITYVAELVRKAKLLRALPALLEALKSRATASGEGRKCKPAAGPESLESALGNSR